MYNYIISLNVDRHVISFLLQTVETDWDQRTPGVRNKNAQYNPKNNFAEEQIAFQPRRPLRSGNVWKFLVDI